LTLLRHTQIVVSDAVPDAIARSNNARRRVTKDQKVMEAERLLQKEEELATQRKAEGGKKAQRQMMCAA